MSRSPAENCCRPSSSDSPGPIRCPKCGARGQRLERISVKAMLRPEALIRLSASEHRFCATPECPVVYFGIDEVFDRHEIGVRVFQKESAGDRPVCYCFGVSEGDLWRELVETGQSTASARISALVKAARCACEVKNPQGSCCLGNVNAATQAVRTALGSGERVGEETPRHT